MLSSMAANQCLCGSLLCATQACRVSVAKTDIYPNRPHCKQPQFQPCRILMELSRWLKIAVIYCFVIIVAIAVKLLSILRTLPRRQQDL